MSAFVCEACYANGKREAAVVQNRLDRFATSIDAVSEDGKKRPFRIPMPKLCHPHTLNLEQKLRSGQRLTVAGEEVKRTLLGLARDGVP